MLHGYVHVNAYPWGEVAIDQVAVGATPLARAVELTVGPPTVTVTHPWFQPITKTLDVAAGTADQPLEVRVDFERDGALAPGKTIPKEAP